MYVISASFTENENTNQAFVWPRPRRSHTIPVPVNHKVGRQSERPVSEFFVIPICSFKECISLKVSSFSPLGNITGVLVSKPPK